MAEYGSLPTRPTLKPVPPATQPEGQPLPTRPYLEESAIAATRLESQLHYADSELAIVRSNIEALQSREADLIKVRDSALQGLDVLTERTK